MRHGKTVDYNAANDALFLPFFAFAHSESTLETGRLPRDHRLWSFNELPSVVASNLLVTQPQESRRIVIQDIALLLIV